MDLEKQRLLKEIVAVCDLNFVLFYNARDVSWIL